MRTALLLLLLITPAQAQPLPYPKGSGQCASDYVRSGSYCTPKNDRARAAIPKVGACPSGWAQSGSVVRGCADQELPMRVRVQISQYTDRTVREETS
jgi:hypothetical protein